MKKLITILAVVFAPVFVFAADLESILGDIRNLLNTILPLLILLGVIFFVYSLVMFLISKDAAKKEAARDTMIWGIVIFFVILSIWGLVNVISNTFGIQSGGAITGSDIPTVGY